MTTQPTTPALRAFARELVHQSESVQISLIHFETVLVRLEDGEIGVPDFVGRTFNAVQGMLAAAGVMSKILWPPTGAAKQRGRAIRSALGLGDELKDRRIRDSLEHVDDRLDSIFADGKVGFSDRNVGPIASFGNGRFLRNFDPDTMTLSVLNRGGELDHISLIDVLTDVAIVRERAECWLRDESGHY